MAALSEIKKGKKFYRTIAGNSKNKFSLEREKITDSIYVIDIDIPGSRVLASLNGSPAKWFNKQYFSRWTEINPNNVNRIATCPACTLYSAGGRSRIAITHTCGQ
jgi:hypothetical protein